MTNVPPPPKIEKMTQEEYLEWAPTPDLLSGLILENWKDDAKSLKKGKKRKRKSG
jgi:hypothetical protein